MFLRNRFFKWASFSLIGNIALSELLFSLPLLIAFTFMSSRDGTLSLALFGYAIVICALGGVVFALIMWFMVARPLIKRRHLRRPVV
jgi:hypothetical protein